MNSKDLNLSQKLLGTTEIDKCEMDNFRPLLSIVIVNFNGKCMLANCFDSIKKYTNFSYEIILVDNASEDGSPEYVLRNYPDVRLVVSSINTGFSGGNNIGARLATGKYILLLNNDTVICSPLKPMVERMQSNPCLGVLGCQLRYGSGKLQESIGYAPNALSLIFSWTPLTSIFPNVKTFRRTICCKSPLYKKDYIEVDWVSGACLMTRSDLWNKLSGLDEAYFMYMEDVDYCVRARMAGYLIAYTVRTNVIHFEGAGRHWVGTRALLNTTDSYITYFTKFYRNIYLLLVCLFLGLVFFIRALGYMGVYIMRLDFFGAEKSRAYFYASLKLIRRIFCNQ